MSNAFFNANSGFSLWRVAYTTVAGHQTHWDVWASNKQHAWQSAHELLPLTSKITNVFIKEEW